MEKSDTLSLMLYLWYSGLKYTKTRMGVGMMGEENDYAICLIYGQIYFCCGRTNMCCNHWCGLAYGTEQVSKKEEGGKLQQWPQTCCMFNDDVGSCITKGYNKMTTEWGTQPISCKVFTCRTPGNKSVELNTTHTSHIASKQTDRSLNFTTLMDLMMMMYTTTAKAAIITSWSDGPPSEM